MGLPSIQIETAPNPRHVVIWLHGLGADGRDFEPIVPELVDRAWPALRFVFPDAPMRPITINGGMPMRAWYDISGQEIAQRQDEVGIRASIGLLDELIAGEVARGVASENILLAGFSQGGAIVLAGGIRHAQRLGGIIALSTYLPMAEKTDAEISAANRTRAAVHGPRQARSNDLARTRRNEPRLSQATRLPGRLAHVSDGAPGLRGRNRRSQTLDRHASELGSHAP